MNDHASLEHRVQKLVSVLRIVLIVVVVGGLLWGGNAWYKNRQHTQETKAYSLLFEAERLEQLGAQEAQALKQEAFIAMKNWSPERKKEYEDKLLKVIATFPTSSAALAANLRMGRWKLNNGQHSEAIAFYEKILSENVKKDWMVYHGLAYEGLGVAYEAQNKFQEAADIFSKALKVNDNPLKPLAYLGHARVLLQMGKTAEAKAQYEQIVKEFSGTQYEKKAKSLIGINKL